MDWDQKHVELEWTPPKSDGGRPLTGYVVQKKEKGSPYWVNAVHVPPKQTNVSRGVAARKVFFPFVKINFAGFIFSAPFRI